MITSIYKIKTFTNFTRSNLRNCIQEEGVVIKQHMLICESFSVKDWIRNFRIILCFLLCKFSSVWYIVGQT